MNGTHQEQFSASRSKDDPSRLQGVFSSRASEHAGADCEIDYGGSPYSCLGFSRHCGARAECIFYWSPSSAASRLAAIRFWERSRTCGWKRMETKLCSIMASAKSSAKAAHCKPQKNCFDSTVPQPCPDYPLSPLAPSGIAATTSCGSWKVLASTPKMISLFPTACSCSLTGCWRSII